MMNQETRNGYFAELCIRLQKEGFTTQPPKDGLLPVQWNGRPLCRITESGSIRYRQQDMIDVDTQLACDRAIDVATVTIEYMKLMEQAPPLKANGLEEGYKLLAEFNGTVLAGHPTRYGTEFITWDRIQNNTALWQGHYHSSYIAAKQDFASRAGLIDKHQLFSPEQLTEIYRSIHETMDEAYPITEERTKLLESAAEQIEFAVPDLDKRVQESNQKEMEVAEQGPQPSMTQQF